MSQLTERKQINALIFLFSAIYMISYITRINYGAVIAEMVNAEGLTKSALSLSVTGSFITYGAGQVISGFFGDRFQPKSLIFSGLIVTVLMNLLIPLCQTPFQMLAVWCVNGFAQAFMWPPMVRLMSSLFPDSDYKRACVIVSWGGSVGTILIYLASPLLIALSGWRAVFFASAFCGIAMAFTWKKFCPSIASQKEIPKPVRGLPSCEKQHIWTPLMFFIMLTIVLQGTLRDGVTTWMPSYISETYNLSSIIAILTGVILPIFSIGCLQVAQWLYRKVFTNLLVCSGAIFFVGLISAVMLVFLTGNTPIASIGFSALLAGAMHGVNLILLCMIPAYFKKYKNVSLISGVLNSCTYIGSAVSTYGIAMLSENFGWTFTLIVWCAIALVGTALCFSLAPAWKRQFQDNE